MVKHPMGANPIPFVPQHFYQQYHMYADNLGIATWIPFTDKFDQTEFEVEEEVGVDPSNRFPPMDPGKMACCGAIALCDVELLTCTATCDRTDSQSTIQIWSDSSGATEDLVEANDLRATTGYFSLTAGVSKVLPLTNLRIIPAGDTWGVKVLDLGYPTSGISNIRLTILTKQTIPT